ncbi:Histone acetyltransferase complex component-like protein [Hibiscus syriacus]|uniref:Histone acetyltransferase complex component-like protein n=1 Tax=Hibiscus syriacus TaxID=106335 RepID=A0A6A3BI63_HIBSY|nr:Histone acetyltransferase complex component-like protein [Hibiscus syriacus]
MSASTNSTPVNEKGEQVLQDFKLLDAVNDRYGGVVVEVTVPLESTLFTSMLRASIAQWRQQWQLNSSLTLGKFSGGVQGMFGRTSSGRDDCSSGGDILGKRGVWIKLPIQHSNLVDPAVKEGFWYHHAEPNYLMLCYWIPEGTHTLPANASHRVGIGAFVMNEKREVLVVQENTGRFRGTGVWKFPTGVVDEGEDICAAAVREVKEETAETEIEAAKWMPFEEYASQPFVQKHELLKYIVDICLAKKDGNYSGFSPVHTSSSFSDENNYMYFNTRDLEGQ